MRLIIIEIEIEMIRILQLYISGMTVELNNILRRKNDALPANELKLKVLKVGRY